MCFKVEIKLAVGSEWFWVIKHDYLYFPEASKNVFSSVRFNTDGRVQTYIYLTQGRGIDKQSLDILLEGKTLKKKKTPE